MSLGLGFEFLKPCVISFELFQLPVCGLCYEFFVSDAVSVAAATVPCYDGL